MTLKLTRTYEARGWSKDASEDDYEKGQMFDGSEDFSFGGSDVFTASTIHELVGKLMDFCNVERTNDDALTVWDDEPSRIDIVVEEDRDGDPITDQHREDWKRGNARLWYCTYTFYIERVLCSPVSLPALFPEANRA